MKVKTVQRRMIGKIHGIEHYALAAAVRCRGLNRRYAVACRNQTLNPSGFCYLHWKQGALFPPIYGKAMLKELKRKPRL